MLFGVFLNVRSLSQEKFDEIKIFVLQNRLDYFALCETWLNKNSPIHLYSIDGYKMINNCRMQARGGGTLLWINDKLQTRVLNYTVTAKDSQYEQLAVRIAPVVLVVIFRPPQPTWTL